MAPRLDDQHFSAGVDTPIGRIKIIYNQTHILSAFFENNTLDIYYNTFNNQLLREFKHQISFYFSGQLKTFDLPVQPAGTVFQQMVWKALQDIPFGGLISYGDLAYTLGGREKTRAVASAIAKNPILILIPCHRVIGSDGKLTGFSGGIDRKRALISIESNQIDF
ncbi:MAG: methylated-DNA--[protein]-cysteine S-methyltransferase [Bacteroidota bacterium]|jgi:methylated-DNA-[protein]-cysteine S-methyltransferase